MLFLQNFWFYSDIHNKHEIRELHEDKCSVGSGNFVFCYVRQWGLIRRGEY